jgi:hypothetical protein
MFQKAEKDRKKVYLHSQPPGHGERVTEVEEEKDLWALA